MDIKDRRTLNAAMSAAYKARDEHVPKAGRWNAMTDDQKNLDRAVAALIQATHAILDNPLTKARD